MRKVILTLLVFTSVISMSSQVFAAATCMNEEQAREALLFQKDSLRNQIKKQYDVYAVRSTVTQGIMETYWDESRQVFATGTLHYWACGPGAECWVHATLTCEGKVSLFEIGD